jgi:putative membrane protein
MFGRARRAVPAVAAALAAGLVATGSLAVADDHHDGDHHHHATCDQGRYSAWDEQWLMSSIEGDLFEIQGGKLAQERGTSDKVRELGKVLVEDHSKALEDATELAEEYGIEVPDEPSPSQQWELRAVAQFDGKAFDQWYSDLEVQDHMQDIQEAQDEHDKGCNHDIREDAEDEIPVLQYHLELSQAALAEAGGASED